MPSGEDKKGGKEDSSEEGEEPHYLLLERETEKANYNNYGASESFSLWLGGLRLREEDRERERELDL